MYIGLELYKRNARKSISWQTFLEASEAVLIGSRTSAQVSTMIYLDSRITRQLPARKKKRRRPPVPPLLGHREDPLRDEATAIQNLRAPPQAPQQFHFISFLPLGFLPSVVALGHREFQRRDVPFHDAVVVPVWKSTSVSGAPDNSSLSISRR